MGKIKIYIIASVSSLFIGVSVGTLVMQSNISDWSVALGIAAAAGGMMIEITVPEMLITVWNKVGKLYRIAAIVATVATPALLIFALSDIGGIAQFSIAFIVASLVAYLSFYAAERMKRSEALEQKITTIKDASQIAIEEQERRARFELEIALEKAKAEAVIEIEKREKLAVVELAEKERLTKVQAQEERKTQKALAKITGKDILPYNRETVLELVRSEPGLSKRELGRRFGKSPQVVMNCINDLILSGEISANGHGVRYNDN